MRPVPAPTRTRDRAVERKLEVERASATRVPKDEVSLLYRYELAFRALLRNLRRATQLHLFLMFGHPGPAGANRDDMRSLLLRIRSAVAGDGRVFFLEQR